MQRISSSLHSHSVSHCSTLYHSWCGDIGQRLIITCFIIALFLAAEHHHSKIASLFSVVHKDSIYPKQGRGWDLRRQKDKHGWRGRREQEWQEVRPGRLVRVRNTWKPVESNGRHRGTDGKIKIMCQFFLINSKGKHLHWYLKKKREGNWHMG